MRRSCHGCDAFLADRTCLVTGEKVKNPNTGRCRSGTPHDEECTCPDCLEARAEKAADDVLAAEREEEV